MKTTNEMLKDILKYSSCKLTVNREWSLYDYSARYTYIEGSFGPPVVDFTVFGDDLDELVEKVYNGLKGMGRVVE